MARAAIMEGSAGRGPPLADFTLLDLFAKLILGAGLILRLYLYTIFFLTIIFWMTFVIFIFYTNPNKADILTFSIFFLSLFLALFGTASLLGFYFRLKFTRKGAIFGYLKVALRQGALISVFILGNLAFLALNIFTWWTATLYFVIIGLLELILRTK